MPNRTANNSTLICFYSI